MASVPQCLRGLGLRTAQHQQLIGPVGQTAWACSVNDTGMSLLLLPLRSQILPHMLTICKGQQTAADSFIQWVSRQQSGQRLRMVFAPDSLRPLLFSHLPVWPSTRHLWPSPCSVLEGGGPWKSWIRVGECGSPGLSGRRSSRGHKLVLEGSRCTSPTRQSPLGNGVRWVASRPASTGHHVGVSRVFQRGTQGPQCCGGWGISVECTSTEGSHLPGIVCSTQSRSSGCSRDRRPLVRGGTQFPFPIGQSKGAVSSPHPAWSRSSGLAAQVVVDARLCGFPCIRPVPVGPSCRLWF